MAIKNLKKTGDEYTLRNGHNSRRIFNYKGREITLTAIRYRFADESAIQDGIMVHDSHDQYSNGDFIVGNGVTVSEIEYISDLETLLTDTSATTHFTVGGDGIYHIDA